jgi:hypothetical protein
MEAKARRQRLLLAFLVVLLAAAIWWSFGPAGSGALPGVADRARATGPVARGRAVVPAAVERVALDVLHAPAPEPVAAGRNPFRFQAEAPPSVPADDGRRDESGNAPEGPMVQAPPGAPAAAPIPVRFIGTVDEVARHLKLAVLSDGRNVFYGREGDIIEGRYRIVRIGVESIEMMHVDGRGQQTIRLSGS